MCVLIITFDEELDNFQRTVAEPKGLHVEQKRLNKSGRGMLPQRANRDIQISHSLLYTRDSFGSTTKQFTPRMILAMRQQPARHIDCWKITIENRNKIQRFMITPVHVPNEI